MSEALFICPCGVRKLPCQYLHCLDSNFVQRFQEEWGIALLREYISEKGDRDDRLEK